MAQRSTGVVKWFNNKAGYGFLTLVGENQTPEDIFVHHSEIQVGKDQYKYLVQGEYVEFLVSNDAGQHKCLAKTVSGVNGGKLMCETRNERQQLRPQQPQTQQPRPRPQQEHTQQRPRPTVTMHTDDEQVEWLLVKRTRATGNDNTTTRGRGRGNGSGRGRRPMIELA